MFSKDKIEILLVSMSTKVGTPMMENVDKELTPILEELMREGPELNTTAASRLYNWLTVPNRTEEEFSYVIGPLKWHVMKQKIQHF